MNERGITTSYIEQSIARVSVFIVALCCIFLLLMPVSAKAIDLTDEERQYLEEHPTLRVQALDNFPPFNFNDSGTPGGYSIDYMNLIGEVIGSRIEYISNKPWLEYLRMLRSGELDIIPHIAVTEERKEFIDFTPFIHIEFTSAIAVNNNLNISSLEDLQGKVIAVASKTFLHSYMVKNYPRQSLLITPTTYDAITAVSEGKADAVIGSLPSLDYYIQKFWLSNISVTRIAGFNFPSKTELPMGVAKGNHLLISILTKAHKAISYNQRLELTHKWMPQEKGAEVLTSLTLEEQKYLAEKKHLTMCVDPGWMPMEGMEDGKHTGIAADFMSGFKELFKIPVDIYPAKSWSDSLLAGKEGQCDFFPLLIENPERTGHLIFTQPYITTPLVLTTRVETPYINDISRLKNVKIGIARDYMFHSTLETRFPGLEFVKVENIEDGLSRVRDGSLFGYADSLISAGYWIQKCYLGDLKVSGEIGKSLSLRVGVQQDQSLLKNIFDKAVNRLTPDKRQEMVNHWIAIQYQNGTDWKTVFLYSLGIVALFSAVIFWYVRINHKLRNEVQQRQKAEHSALVLAKTDQLTGLLNRHGCESLFNVHMERRRSENTPVSIMLVDLDHFKVINDSYGHQTGDEVLKEISHTLKSITRDTDHKVRWGGEEFLILVSDTGLERAIFLAEKLRSAIGTIHNPELPHVTVSIGVAEYEPAQSFKEWYEAADSALYQAKKLGRNRVCYHNPESETEPATCEPEALELNKEYS